MMLGLGISAVTALILIAVAVLLKKRKDNRPQPVFAANENVAADTASSDTAEADSACSSDIAATDESKADGSRQNRINNANALPYKLRRQHFKRGG